MGALLQPLRQVEACAAMCRERRRGPGWLGVWGLEGGVPCRATCPSLPPSQDLLGGAPAPISHLSLHPLCAHQGTGDKTPSQPSPSPRLWPQLLPAPAPPPSRPACLPRSHHPPCQTPPWPPSSCAVTLSPVALCASQLAVPQPLPTSACRLGSHCLCLFSVLLPSISPVPLRPGPLVQFPVRPCCVFQPGHHSELGAASWKQCCVHLHPCHGAAWTQSRDPRPCDPCHEASGTLWVSHGLRA